MSAINHHLAVTLTQSIGDGGLKPRQIFRGDFQTIDDQFDIVILITVEHHVERQIAQLSIHPHCKEAFFSQLLKKFLIVALAVFDDRSENIDLVPVVTLKNQVDDLLFRVFDHRLAGDIADSRPHSRIEKSQEVVYLRGGADGASRIAVDGLLLDSDHRAESRDLVDIRTFEIAEHIPCISRKGFNVASLAFGKNSIESQ